MNRFLLSLVVLLSGCALVTLASKQRSWPETAGVTVVDGISAPVSIHRDAHGIPHIRAATTADALYGLGFVHAQDRLFQLDLTRRFTWGRLSELFGERAAEYDLFAAGLRLEKRGEAALKMLGPREREWVVAYTAGINAGATSLSALPVEYRLLGVEFEPWRPVDSMGNVLTMSWSLSENADVEAAALQLADVADADTIDALFRLDSREPAVDPYWDTLRALDIGPFTAGSRAWAGFSDAPSDSQASNNWVIGPSKSTDGAPIVVNDPHLRQRVPSIWYTADLQGGGIHLAGATFPGNPGVVIGHNGKVAWGLTNTMADVVDLAVVERVGETGYRLGGEQLDLERVDVEIALKDGTTRTGTTWWTEVGPVVSELTGTHLVAMRWHAFEVDDASIPLFADLATADTAEAAVKAVVNRPSIVSQNLVLADTTGDFGWQVFGSVVRRKGFSGRVPYPAYEARYGWQGFIDDLPGERAPARGWLHTANARPVHPMASAISTGFVPPHRHGRIAQLLEGDGKVSPDDMRAMQLDVTDVWAAEAVPRWLAGVEPSTPAAQQCADILGAWDFEARTDSAGQAVYAVLTRELIREALSDDLGPTGLAVYFDTATSGRSLAMGRLDHFRDDPEAETDRALHAACTWLGETLGDDPSLWTWGALHRLVLRHPFGGSLSAWNLDAGPYPGSGSTIAAAGHRVDDFEPTGIASLRIVMPLSDLGASTLSYPGGQSGHPGHPHARDQLDPFMAGAPVPLWFHDDDVAAATVETLILQPASR